MKPSEIPAPGGVSPLVLAALVALAGVGCTSAGDAASETVRRDSAGIEIVESAGPLWGEGEGWRLSDTPTLDIGALEGAPEEQLYRVTGAFELEDGRIVVANLGSHEIRFYGADGTFESALGSEGDGPGEFQFLTALSRAGGDTLRVWDPSARRISDLSTAGEFLGSTHVSDDEGNFSNYVATLPDGRMVMSITSIPGVEGLEDGRLLERSSAYWTYSPAGEPLAELATLPGGARITRVQTSNGNVTGVNVISPPFRPDTPVGLQSDRLVAALTDRFEVRYLDVAGGLTRIVRYDDELEPITPTLIDEWVNRAPPERRAVQRGWIADVPMPDFVPTAQVLVMDLEGNAWVRRYSDDRETPSRWTIIGADGAWLGTVEMPPRFRPLEIGADYVLGHWTDEVDVEHIRRFELVK